MSVGGFTQMKEVSREFLPTNHRSVATFAFRGAVSSERVHDCHGANHLRLQAMTFRPALQALPDESCERHMLHRRYNFLESMEIGPLTTVFGAHLSETARPKRLSWMFPEVRIEPSFHIGAALRMIELSR